MDIDKLNLELQHHGYSIINNFLSDISDIKSEVCSLLEREEDDSSYKFGKALRIGSIEENRFKNPNVCKILGQSWMTQLSHKYLNKERLFTEIFITNDSFYKLSCRQPYRRLVLSPRNLVTVQKIFEAKN